MFCNETSDLFAFACFVTASASVTGSGFACEKALICDLKIDAFRQVKIQRTNHLNNGAPFGVTPAEVRNSVHVWKMQLLLLKIKFKVKAFCDNWIFFMCKFDD